MGESDIARVGFEILCAWDEVVTLGWRENVNLQQVRSVLEMESHEEKIQEIIARVRLFKQHFYSHHHTNFQYFDVSEQGERSKGRVEASCEAARDPASRDDSSRTRSLLHQLRRIQHQAHLSFFFRLRSSSQCQLLSSRS